MDDEELKQKIYEITQTMFVTLSEWQAGVTIDWESAKIKGRQEILELIKSRDQQIADNAITEFCKDIQHKVEMSFNIHPAGHIVMPWEDTVRPIIYERASLKQPQGNTLNEGKKQ